MSDLENPKYPPDNEIKVEWTTFHKMILIFTTLLIWVWFFVSHGFSGETAFNKFLSLLGLNIDIVGVTIASLKPPYYGLFCDGGAIEFKRQKAEHESFKRGMFLIALGLLFQALGVLV
ncbi:MULTISPECIES: hypothetical protein [Methylomicrobium]|uniref:hypothetical protein n=1 Tax=Methylomicrobium TaxID=39773 RepID=UPI0002624015|nr:MULTISPECIES: hypothetical protein [Methylomicrobium]